MTPSPVTGLPPGTDRATGDGIVLAGGRGRRLGGVDKAAIVVDGEPLLDRAVAALRPCRTVVVGPARPTRSPVLWAREDPPYGGPAAALAAGLEALRTSGAPAALTVVVAVDLPALATALPVLRAAVDPEDDACDGWVARDPDGRAQPLLAVYRTAPLRHAAERLRRSPDGIDGRAMRVLTADLRLREVPLDAASTADVDTPDHLAALTRPAPTEEHAR